MENKWFIASAAVFALLVVAGIASAQMSWRDSDKQKSDFKGMMGGGMMNGNSQYHEEMYKIMKEGTFADLQILRQKIGFDIMSWVENEEDFKLAKEMHERMNKFQEGKNLSKSGFGCQMMR